ncbi:MAG: hypothetical protein L0I29_13755 [Hyphomicrobiales bacterium]|nr:hypothetical protein [Hyphomicrobiales bacterium]
MTDAMLSPDSPVKSRASLDKSSASGERLKSLEHIVRSRRIASRPLLIAAAGSVCLLAAGCTGAPTYGTGTPADKQLLNDVTGIIQLGPKDKPRIDNRPRPELVRPSKSEVAVLPPPQNDVATSANPQWPESPEARRQRLRMDATAHQSDPSYVPDIEGPAPSPSRGGVVHTKGYDVNLDGSGLYSNADQAKEFKRRQAINKQGSPAVRRYLSEPPLTYRQPAATASSDELGKDEWKKQRDRKKDALKGKKTGFQFSDLWPF